MAVSSNPSSIFFFKIQAPHPPHKGSAVCLNIEHWTDSRLALQLLCHPPHSGTLPKLQEDDKKCKIIVRNKAFESGREGTLIFTSYKGLGPASTVHPKINISLSSYQQTALYSTSGHAIHLSASAIGWSSRDFKPCSTGDL